MVRLPSPLRRALTALTWLAATALVAPAQAAYPEQPIKVLVSYGAGGGTDIVARLLAPYIGKYLAPNASVVVVNRPGAGGAIGFTELAKAALESVMRQRLPADSISDQLPVTPVRLGAAAGGLAPCH